MLNKYRNTVKNVFEYNFLTNSVSGVRISNDCRQFYAGLRLLFVVSVLTKVRQNQHYRNTSEYRIKFDKHGSEGGFLRRIKDLTHEKSTEI